MATCSLIITICNINCIGICVLKYFKDDTKEVAESNSDIELLSKQRGFDLGST